MDWRLMFKGDYIQAVEFGESKPTFTISEVRICKLEGEDGRTKDKGVVFFEGKDRGWVLCKTNAICLAAMFGTDTSTWVGKRVTLYSTMVQVGKSKQPGIRVRGSPDLTAPLSVEIKLPRKKPITVEMQATGERRNGSPPASTPPKPMDDREVRINRLWLDIQERVGKDAKKAWQDATKGSGVDRDRTRWTNAQIDLIAERLSIWPKVPAPEAPTADPPQTATDRGTRLAKLREELVDRVGTEHAVRGFQLMIEEFGLTSTWTDATILKVAEKLSTWEPLEVIDIAEPPDDTEPEPGSEG